MLAQCALAGEAARDIAEAALGRDPGPLTSIPSLSHHVYASADVVVKVIAAAGHSRLDRETALAPWLPAGLTAPLLDSGLHRQGTAEFRYACYTRMPGSAPGMGLPGVDDATARLLAQDAVQRLTQLHQWVPAGQAEQTLAEPLDHGGLVSRAALRAEIEQLAILDQSGIVAPHLLDGLVALAERAPLRARAAVPVHADCHWGNWLAHDRGVTALLDFEWARFGEPADDWFHLVRFSGPHAQAVLAIIARAMATPVEVLQAQCEVREAAYLVSDIRLGLERPGFSPAVTADRLAALEELIIGQYWWRLATRSRTVVREGCYREKRE